jgi:hypothetical protein
MGLTHLLSLQSRSRNSLRNSRRNLPKSNSFRLALLVPCGQPGHQDYASWHAGHGTRGMLFIS